MKTFFCSIVFPDLQVHCINSILNLLAYEDLIFDLPFSSLYLFLYQAV